MPKILILNISSYQFITPRSPNIHNNYYFHPTTNLSDPTNLGTPHPHPHRSPALAYPHTLHHSCMTNTPLISQPLHTRFIDIKLERFGLLRMTETWVPGVEDGATTTLGYVMFLHHGLFEDVGSGSSRGQDRRAGSFRWLRFLEMWRSYTG